MIWLTWRQFRVQASAAAAVLAAFAILLAATGPHLASRYAASGITGCRGGACSTAAARFLNGVSITTPYAVVYTLGMGLILAAPGVLGIFWGAPLIAREFENRTLAVAWTQSITRYRWLMVKLALTGLAAVTVTEALSLMYGWWAEPIGRAIGLGGSQYWQLPGVFSRHQFSQVIFPTHGITPIGYAAFGFTLGVATGAVFRRALPAMAVTLAIFAAVQVAMPLLARPHFIPPERTVVSGPSFFVTAGMSVGTLEASTVPGQPAAWLLSSGAINAAGQPVRAIPAPCNGPSSQGKGAPSDAGACMASRGIREAITYQPVSRYWAFQWIETGIYLALALVLARVCFWRLGRRQKHPDETALARGSEVALMT